MPKLINSAIKNKYQQQDKREYGEMQAMRFSNHYYYNFALV